MSDEFPVSYDVDADMKFKKALFRAASSGLNLSFSMGEAVRIIKKESTKNFILKSSGQYPPLSKPYRRRKMILSPGAPILTGSRPGKTRNGLLVSGGGVSRKLKRSIIETTTDSVIRIGVRSLELGTKAESSKGAPYPRYVQDGTRKMPGRKFLFFSQAMVRQIINTIDADIKNQLEQI